MKLNTHQINIIYETSDIVIDKHQTQWFFILNTEVIWKPSHFFTSLTNKLQESRFFQRFASSPFATKRWKESTFAAKATKNHWKKVVGCFFYYREPACFCCFVCGEKRPFLIVQVSTVEVMLCFAGCRLMSGFFSGGTDARVPEPGNRSGWGWAAPGGCARRKSSTSIMIAVWIGSKRKVVRVPLYSEISYI